ncbi:MAG: DUF1553 domain-containing protein, partial [Verrucomicrobiota bacterium]
APTPANVSAARLEVYPTDLKLESRRAARQLVVTAYVDGEARDVTHLATFRSSNGQVVQVAHGAATPTGNGTARLTVAWGGKEFQVPVTVANFTQPDPVLFKFETMAVLTKQGCATGSCHGSPVGKAGFALSLFGYDPTIDRRSLTRDGFSRRINSVEPAESLILRKPLMELDHVGGKKLHKNEAPYQTLLTWIAEGANVDLPAVECVRLAVFPGPDRVLKAPNLTQQLSVLAYFSDGRVRDVTSIATYDTSSAELAVVDAAGRVTGRQRGQAAISVRYLSQVQSVNFTTIEDVPGFEWKAPPETNFVDTLVNAKLRQLQYVPAETCDDATFVRRLYLDLTGLIPTGDDARRFIESKVPDKRAQLIDELIAGEDFARFWALKDADLMRVSKTRMRDGRAEMFSEWLVNAQRQDMPYTDYARRLLTAKGDTLAVPEANFLFAIAKPEERTEMTAQLFLGSRLDCTKCHNHPYEKWTMNDYYSLSAVFARTASDQGIISTTATGESVHPLSKLPMRPWGATAATPDTADRREGFASWLTQPDNPLFARVEVNRLWMMCFGTGIVATQENFGMQGDPPTHPELLDTLAFEFSKDGWDVKRMLKRLVMSATFRQTSAATREKFEADPKNQWLSRGPSYRLCGEAIRDQALLAAGLLVEKSGGPSVKPWQPAGIWSEAGASGGDYQPDSGEGLHRRSLYTFWKRTVPPPGM